MTHSEKEAGVISNNRLQSWVLNHDSSIVFNVLYIGLAVILSIWLGLFWLVAVVFVHALIEFYRQYLLSLRVRFSMVEALWEIKLDIALIIFAFWLGIYLDFIFGIVGLSAGMRATAQVSGRIAQTGTRAAVWQRLIRGVLISLDDVGLAFRAFAGNKSKGDKDSKSNKSDTSVNTGASSWFGTYTLGDKFTIAFGLMFFMLIILTPLLTDKSVEDVLWMVAREMKPFP